MGNHVWGARCPYCGFEEMIAYSHNEMYFGVNCQICGYARWTEEKVPDHHDIELAKRAVREMDSKEKEKATEQYSEDNVPLVARLKEKFLEIE